MATPSIAGDQVIPPPPPVTGRLWHAIRNAGGGWLGPNTVDTEISVPGPVTTAAGTYDGITGEAQFMFATADGLLWHTIRYSGGGWQPTGPVNDVISVSGPVTAVAAATDGTTGETQFMFTTADGLLWHTRRHYDGHWQPTGSVNGQISIPGPVAAICATGDGTAGETQYMYTTGGGASLWQTTRLAGGGWTTPDPLNSKFTLTDPVMAVAATGDGLPGEAQFLVVMSGLLRHTTRRAGGDWSGLGIVNDQFSPPIPAQPSIQAVAATYDDVLGEAQFIFTKNDGTVWRITRGNGYSLENVTSALSLTSAVTTVAASGDGESGEAQFLLVM